MPQLAARLAWVAQVLRKVEIRLGFGFRLRFGLCPFSHSHGRSWHCSSRLACLWRHDAVVRLLMKSRARPEQIDHGGQSLGLSFEKLFIPMGPARESHCMFL